MYKLIGVTIQVEIEQGQSVPIVIASNNTDYDFESLDELIGEIQKEFGAPGVDDTAWLAIGNESEAGIYTGLEEEYEDNPFDEEVGGEDNPLYELFEEGKIGPTFYTEYIVKVEASDGETSVDQLADDFEINKLDDDD